MGSIKETDIHPRSPILLPNSPDLGFETQLKGEGFRVIAGLDEAGRGAWAGPVTAAAVVLPNDEHILKILSGVRDSKQMTARQREREESCIKAASIAWAVGSASEGEIDELGIVPATRLAMQRALEQLTNSLRGLKPDVSGAHGPTPTALAVGSGPDHLLIDYISLLDSPIPQTSLVKGDCRSLSIAAASVLAKTARDAFMVAQDAAYPGYGFARHKGYGTAQHRAALKELGVTEFHRKTFRPVAELLTP